ncbi:MAG: hypothetical protein ACM3ON_05370 [Chloroflexota bacterium]
MPMHAGTETPCLTIPTRAVRGLAMGAVVALCLFAQGCLSYEWAHQIQWESRDQILTSEESQVKLRAAQTRLFDTADRTQVLRAAVYSLQDLNFQVEVLDEELGIVSGKKFVEIERPKLGYDPTYHLYDDSGLLLFTRQYHRWGPFWHRSDLVRMTVTVRKRNEAQLIVRASAQFYLRPLEQPGPYQMFFRTLEQALFIEGHPLE